MANHTPPCCACSPGELGLCRGTVIVSKYFGAKLRPSLSLSFPVTKECAGSFQSGSWARDNSEPQIPLGVREYRVAWGSPTSTPVVELPGSQELLPSHCLITSLKGHWLSPSPSRLGLAALLSSLQSEPAVQVRGHSTERLACSGRAEVKSNGSALHSTVALGRGLVSLASACLLSA